jgi:hypothetical protein
VRTKQAFGTIVLNGRYLPMVSIDTNVPQATFTTKTEAPQASPSGLARRRATCFTLLTFATLPTPFIFGDLKGWLPKTKR